jgi:hypothetical protein
MDSFNFAYNCGLVKYEIVMKTFQFCVNINWLTMNIDLRATY